MTHLLDQFRTTRRHTETLCEPLSIEDFLPQAVAWVSPPKWHLAHTTWFFEEMILLKYVSGYRVFNTQYRYLFNSYYNSVGERLRRDHRGLISRPSLEDVFAYRKHVTEHMYALLQAPVNKELLYLTELGIHHEQQHQELLLTDLKYTFWHNPTYPSYHEQAKFCEIPGGPAQDLDIEQGLFTIGHAGTDFCFDNEKGQHPVFLGDFSIASQLVCNGDYLAFIEDQGYQRPELWLDDGWTWLQQTRINAPLYWLKEQQQWYQYTLAGLRPLEDAHVLSHVSFYEANAFATWCGKRLASEFEWETAARLHPEQFQWGQRWEWTYSAYHPYPGFSIAEGAVGEYNGKFMINQMVLRGASAATSPGHARVSYRNFFHPEMRWQYKGIRLAK